MSNNLFRKSYLISDNAEKYCRGKQTIDDDIIRRMHFACWIIKATDTHSAYVIFMASERQLLLSEGTSMLRPT